MVQRRHLRANAVGSTARRLIAVSVGVALMAAGSPSARPADSAVPSVRERTSSTVTADALPTVQINGIVWVQVMIGNVVYAGGEFTSARPAGAARGVDETPRKNLLAYDITTGELIATFAPAGFNGAVRALAVSSDKRTLYVGGDFTKAGNDVRNRFAALSASTGSLKSTNISFNKTVRTLVADSRAVYVGGTFTLAGGKKRDRLAAIKVSNGKLSTWKAEANSTVKALVLTKGSKLLVAGGHFTKLNSTKAPGSGAISPKTGKVETWKINKIVKNGGKKGTRSSSIMGLAVDGDTVYGTGMTWGSGNFEGVFAASSKDGTLRWLQDCHGDTYSVAPIGDVVYSVGHAHYCSNIGGFPDTSDDAKRRTTWYRALAVTKKAAGTVGKNGQTSSKAYTNFKGRPAPALLNWFPRLSSGTFTGEAQAAWSIVGNRTYVSMGGEFPMVNGTPQEGLVRMAIPSVAPNKVGPAGIGDMGLSAQVQSGGKVALDWRQLWDRDDMKLTYSLTRNETLIYKRTVSVPFWKRSRMTFVDADAYSDPSSTLKYYVTVTDPNGNSVTSSGARVDRPSDSPPVPTPSPVPTLSVSPSPTESSTPSPDPAENPTAGNP